MDTLSCEQSVAWDDELSQAVTGERVGALNYEALAEGKTGAGVLREILDERFFRAAAVRERNGQTAP